MLDDALRVYDRTVDVPDAHGNQRLHLRGMLGTLLAAAFEPATRSLRTIDDLSLYPSVRAVSGVDRVARSTLSDAMAKFDPELLRPMFAALAQQLPMLKRHDPQTADVVGRLVAADGSWFNLAGEVVHAIECRRGNTGRVQSRVRLNLQLDVDSFLPVDCDVSGKGDGSEAQAFIRRLMPGCVYLADRNFVHFAFMNAIIEKESNFVVRWKKGVNFDVHASCCLTDTDRMHDVCLDQTGRLPGPTSAGNTDARSCTSKPPTQTLRRVSVWDQNNKCLVMLLTDLLDVPAYVIGVLYRMRWQIELFLRWLKVLASFSHLISQSPRGITMQFYVAVLMTLMIHVQAGHRRVSKYALIWVSWIAHGRATPDMMAEAMARHDRERANARKRREKNKASA
jgi:hypothetical protein